MQTYTSSATSINKAKLPAVYRKATFSAPFVLDYGCGRYTDHIHAFLNKEGRALFPFDPFNQPDVVNNETTRRTHLSMQYHIPLDVVCSNVLNVIDDVDTIRKIADQIQTVVERTGGTAYITVYEGDRSCIGRATGHDQYQRNEPLRSYLKYFPYGTIRNGMIVVRL